jgi:hypothetical protein
LLLILDPGGHKRAQALLHHPRNDGRVVKIVFPLLMKGRTMREAK